MIFTVRFFEPDDLVAALPAIRELGGTPSEPAPGSTVITVSFDPATREHRGPGRATRARCTACESVEPYALRQLRNDVAAGLMGARRCRTPRG